MAANAHDTITPGLILVAGSDRDECDRLVALLSPMNARHADAAGDASFGPATLLILAGASASEESADAAAALCRNAPGAPLLALVDSEAAAAPEHEIAGGMAHSIDLATHPPTLLRHRVRQLVAATIEAQALRAACHRAEQLLQLAKAAVWEVDAKGSLRCSRELRELAGTASTAEEPNSLTELVADEDRLLVEDALEQARDGMAFSVRHRLTAEAPATPREVETRGRMVELGGAAVMLGVCVPSDAEVDPDSALARDSLTGLPNRFAIENSAASMQKGARESGNSMAVIQLGLDDFKRLNKAFGRGFGDEVLRVIAKRLREAVEAVLGPEDGEPEPLVGRYGSDEFAILIPRLASEDDAAAVARRALEVIAEPLSLLGNQARVEGCAGIVVGPLDSNDPHALLHRASEALYEAQERGHRNFAFYAGGRRQAYDQLKLESRLREAVDRQEIQLHYQPKVDVQSGLVTGFEALARWNDDELGVVQPEDFIRVAENAGFIHRIGEQTIRKACLQTVAWLEAGLWQGRMAVNVSPIQFMSEGFGDWVLEMIEGTGLDPHYLELEITESCLVEKASTIETLRKVRERGISVAIDDFGTGYSSLQYLRQLPLDALKVDRAFVIDIEKDVGAQHMLETIVGLAKSLDLKVVAEGVETSGQWSLLRDLGCDEIQGYRVSPGVPADRVPEMLIASRSGDSGREAEAAPVTVQADAGQPDENGGGSVQ